LNSGNMVMSSEQAAGVAMGAVSVALGLAIGVAMYADPAGLTEGWKIWAALLAPAALVFGGLFAIVNALGNPALTGIFFKLMALCLVGVVNWAAFAVPEPRCQATFSFLGVAAFERFPTAETCRMSLLIIVLTLDVVIVTPMLGLSRKRGRR